MIWIKLALEFFKAGLFAVGGGLATLPFLRAMAEAYPWFTSEELLDMIAISESTPGPIGVNMATFAGFKTGGILGAGIATFSLVLPSFIIILLVTRFMQNYAENPLVKKAFYVLRPTSVGLIAGAMLDIFIQSFFLGVDNTSPASLSLTIKIIPVTMFIAVIVAIRKRPQIHPIFYILISAVIGVALKLQ